MPGKSKYKSKYQSNPFAPPPNEPNIQSTHAVRRESESNPFSNSLPPYNEGSSTDHSEDHPLLADGHTTGRKRSIGGTICSLCFAFPYFVLAVVPIVVITFLASADKKISCRSNNSCFVFVISGEAIITTLAVGLLLAVLIKTVRGKWLSCFLICDFVLLVIITGVSLVISIVLSIDTTDQHTVVAAWIVWFIAVVLLVFQCVLASCGYMMQRRSKTTSIRVGVHDYNYN